MWVAVDGIVMSVAVPPASIPNLHQLDLALMSMDESALAALRELLDGMDWDASERVKETSTPESVFEFVEQVPPTDSPARLDWVAFVAHPVSELQHVPPRWRSGVGSIIEQRMADVT